MPIELESLIFRLEQSLLELVLLSFEDPLLIRVPHILLISCRGTRAVGQVNILIRDGVFELTLHHRVVIGEQLVAWVERGVKFGFPILNIADRLEEKAMLPPLIFAGFHQLLELEENGLLEAGEYLFPHEGHLTEGYYA